MKIPKVHCSWLMVCTLSLLMLSGCPQTSEDALVVYCSHDAVYAQELLDQFTEETGIPVAVKFDTEATKSLGLVNLLVSEKENPRCDVFWNNEVLGTVKLQQEGVLSPYKGAGFERIPEQFKDPEGYWTGFAARLRVYIVNTDKMEASPDEITSRLEGDLSRMAIAKPIYGTTLTHYSLLWHLWGKEKLIAWHEDNLTRHVNIVNGNGQVKDLVAAGVCDLGWTDTDDYFSALDAGSPVDVQPIRVEGHTISIPNSVAIIRESKHQEAAQRFVDFLLSEQTELKLSQSASRQIPLGTVDESQLPEETRQLREWARESHDLRQILDAHRECLEWLSAEYLK
ncbi:MAG: extracellular solute-binding protein [Planctomycetaceae bacterium]